MTRAGRSIIKWETVRIGRIFPFSHYDVWRLPQADDSLDSCSADVTYLCHRPVFVAGQPGSRISPNLAGRLTATFANCYVLNRASDSALARRCLQNAEHVFALADTSLTDPAASVDGGSCAAGRLLTILPFDGYPETVWSDDMELGATELYLALREARRHHDLPGDGPRVQPAYYLRQAARFARQYIEKIDKAGGADSLNLYDVSGLAYFELYRALRIAGEDTEGCCCRPTGNSRAAVKASGGIDHACKV